MPSNIVFPPGEICKVTGAMLAAAVPIFLSFASRKKISVATLTLALSFESLSTVTLRFTVAFSGEISGVVSCVPHCPTCTGSVLTSHTFR